MAQEQGKGDGEQVNQQPIVMNKMDVVCFNCMLTLGEKGQIFKEVDGAQVLKSVFTATAARVSWSNQEKKVLLCPCGSDVIIFR